METEKAIKDIKRICEFLEQSEYMSIDKDTKISLETILQAFRKQEKMINLMADWIGQEDINTDMCMYEGICNEDECEECVKQYFGNRAEEAE